MKKAIFFVKAFCLSLVLSGCTTSYDEKEKAPYTPSFAKKHVKKKQDKASVAAKHKVALLVPLSGIHAEVGQSLQKAAELALFEHSHQPLELLIYDTRGTAEGARTAATTALQNNAELFLGPLMAHEVTAVKHATQNTIPVLAFSNDYTVASHNVFTLGYAPADQIERLGRYASLQNIKNIVIFTPQDEYGAHVADVFKRLQNLGILKISGHVTYDPEHLEALPVMSASSVQGLFFAEGGKRLEPLLKALQKQGVRLAQFKLLGSSQWNHPAVLHNSSLVGSLYVNSNDQTRKEFEAQYEKTYRSKPNRLASLAYDTVSLAAALIKHYQKQPFARSNLTQNQGFSGADGIFRLKENGTVERGLAIHEVTGTGSRIIDPAPAQF